MGIVGRDGTVMMDGQPEIGEVREALEQLRAGYETRALGRLDSFMDLFEDSSLVEMIGIGATRRGEPEWVQGRDQIREVIESDWTYWGDVDIDIAEARIRVAGDTAWLSTEATLTQKGLDRAMPQYLDQMRDLLDDDADAASRMMEASAFGLARLRERHLGDGHRWPLVITATLTRREGKWRFSLLHWAMSP